METRHIDLLALIGGEYRKDCSSDGGEYEGPCPFCGGENRFSIWPSPDRGNPRFWCRQCDAKGDAIEYIRLRDKVGFREAADILNLPLEPRTYTPARKTFQRTKRLVSQKKDSLALSDEAWQASANTFCSSTIEALWSNAGQRARQYLYKRGLTEEIIRKAQLGYNPQGQKQRWGDTDVWLFRGIVIPWLIKDRYWKVNIRRKPSDIRAEELKIEAEKLAHEDEAKAKAGITRYLQAKGGANGLYGADDIFVGCTAVLTEGEFDTLAIRSQITQPNVVAVATGSTSGSRLLDWVAVLSKADHILIAFDNDESGEEAYKWWLELFSEKATRLRPTRHDVSDMAQAGEKLDTWIASALE